MDFRGLDYFLAAVDAGSLRAAARRLEVSQPALTKAVQRLEDGFGVPLFERHAQGIRLTSFGQALLRHAREIHSALRSARGELAALRRGVAGVVSVGAGPFWLDAVLGDAISDMRRLHPDVQVRVSSGRDDALRGRLKRAEIAFVLAAIPGIDQLDPDYLWEPLLQDHYRVIADRDHPLAGRAEVGLEEILAHPWILPSPATNMVQRLRFVMLSRGLPPPEPVIETDSISLKFKLMLGSDHLSLHAETHLAAYNPGHVVILPVPRLETPREAGVIRRRAGILSPADQALIQAVRDRCRSWNARS